MQVNPEPDNLFASEKCDLGPTAACVVCMMIWAHEILEWKVDDISVWFEWFWAKTWLAMVVLQVYELVLKVRACMVLTDLWNCFKSPPRVNTGRHVIIQDVCPCKSLRLYFLKYFLQMHEDVTCLKIWEYHTFGCTELCWPWELVLRHCIWMTYL